MSHVDVAQAKSCLEELVEQVLRGEDVVITKGDRPVVRLEAVLQKRERQFGSLRGEIWMSDDFDEPLDDFEDYQ